MATMMKMTGRPRKRKPPQHNRNGNATPWSLRAMKTRRWTTRPRPRHWPLSFNFTDASRVTLVLRIVWIVAILWYEVGVFHWSVVSCRWPDKQLKEVNVRLNFAHYTFLHLSLPPFYLRKNIMKQIHDCRGLTRENRPMYF